MRRALPRASVPMVLAIATMCGGLQRHAPPPRIIYLLRGGQLDHADADLRSDNVTMSMAGANTNGKEPGTATEACNVPPATTAPGPKAREFSRGRGRGHL